jgi:hypothetical protein
VTDYDDGADALDTLERSRARKKKDPQPAPVAAAPGASGAGRARARRSAAASAEVHRTRLRVRRGHLRGDGQRPLPRPRERHPAEKDAWRTAQENAKKPTPATQGGKRARKIIDQIEHLQGIDNASTRTTALPNGPGPKAA